MQKRFMSIWFPHLSTDWFTRRHAHLKGLPFVLSAPHHGRMIITATNFFAAAKGLFSGMTVADAKAVIPSLEVMEDKPGLLGKLYKWMGDWFIRFTPYVSIDPLGGLILDITGCCHLWGGEDTYLTTILNRLKEKGYTARAAISDTIGSAWGIARYGKDHCIIKKGEQVQALLHLPPEALRLEIEVTERLHKLGLRQVKDFINIPSYSLRRRFGAPFTQRLNQALGIEEELVQPIYPVEEFIERLPCPEPIVTRTGIEIALDRLLHALCERLQREGKGLRLAFFVCYRADGKVLHISISTNSPSHNVTHLFKLFELKIASIQPAEGIELFMLEAKNVEQHSPVQEQIWTDHDKDNDHSLSEFLDRLTVKMGEQCIERFLPDEHHIPERSFRRANSLDEPMSTNWRKGKQRPIELLNPPHLIEVMAPIPDYPPIHFRYKEKLHKIIKADGPERIEQEWWIGKGKHRDYYHVEDEEGRRYWLFRSGHYSEEKTYKWFIHGFFP
jgi:protein ImuB